MIDNCWLSCRWCECRHFNLSSRVEMKSHFAELLRYNARPSNQSVGTSVRACLFNTVEVCANLYWLSYRLAETRGRSEERKKKKGITCRQSVKAEMFRGVKKCIWNKDYRGKNQASMLDTQTGMQPNAVSFKHDGVTYVQYITLSQGVIPAFWWIFMHRFMVLEIDLKENTAWKHDWI